MYTGNDMGEGGKPVNSTFVYRASPNHLEFSFVIFCCLPSIQTKQAPAWETGCITLLTIVSDLGRKGSKWKKTYAIKYRYLNIFCEVEVFHYINRNGCLGKIICVRSLESVTMAIQKKNSLQVWHMKDVYTDKMIGTQGSKQTYVYGAVMSLSTCTCVDRKRCYLGIKMGIFNKKRK
jgi:hypothetical protein